MEGFMENAERIVQNVESGLNNLVDLLVAALAPKFMQALRPQIVDLIKETVDERVEMALEDIDWEDKIRDNIDTDSLTDEVAQNLDISSLAEEVSQNLDISCIAEEVADKMDADDIASRVRDELNLEDEIKDVLSGMELKVTVA